MSIKRAVLLLSCPDRSGIVAEISNFIYHYQGNIIHSDQHSDVEHNLFFMRIEWDLEGFQLNGMQIKEKFKPIADKFDMDWILKFTQNKIKTAIFVSKMDHCLYDLLIRNKSKELETDIKLIISNHKDTQSIADYFGIPFYYENMNESNKLRIEKEQLKRLKENDIDLIILARYMQILSDDFATYYPNRIINIHHSFLPAFVGSKPYHQAYERGVKIIGATSHFVTKDLDQGPIISQDVIKISHRDTIEDLIQKGKDLEKIVLSRAVKLYLNHKILVSGNKTVIFD